MAVKTSRENSRKGEQTMSIIMFLMDRMSSLHELMGVRGDREFRDYDAMQRVLR